MPGVNSWTAEQDDLLAYFVGQGASASQIGVELGRSRNSVISRAHRKGIKLCEPTPKRDGTRKRVRRPGRDPERSPQLAAVVREKPPSELPKPVAGHPGGVLFLETVSEQCRWPLNQIKPIQEHRCCGERTWHKDASWCVKHAKEAAA
jgi:hypothetical protein